MSVDPALLISVAFIAERESFVAHPYRDDGGVWTIGYGFTVNADGSRVGADSPHVTQEDAYARLQGLVARVLASVRSMVHVPISDHEAAALTSLAYNTGTNALRTSTLMHFLNQGQKDLAANQFAAWVYDNGHVSDGLVKRRKMEKALFLTPDNPQSDVATGGRESPSNRQESAANQVPIIPQGITSADDLNAQELASINPESNP